MAREVKLSLTPDRMKELHRSVDWARVHAMTDAEIEADIANDPDAATPLADAQATAMRVQYVRHLTGLSQAEFARRFRFPVRTLQEWEQARRTPDATVLAYLAVIAKHPEAVMDALQPVA